MYEGRCTVQFLSVAAKYLPWTKLIFWNAAYPEYHYMVPKGNDTWNSWQRQWWGTACSILTTRKKTTSNSTVFTRIYCQWLSKHIFCQTKQPKRTATTTVYQLHYRRGWTIFYFCIITYSLAPSFAKNFVKKIFVGDLADVLKLESFHCRNCREPPW